MKILSAEQIRKTDQFTIENEPIASIDLMERASEIFVDWFTERFSKDKSVIIMCGSGNNGGDGLAAGRLLLNKDYKVDVFVITKGKPGSPDFEKNRKRISGLIDVQEIKSVEDFPAIQKENVVIDAMFGSGLTRQIEGLHAEVVQKLNSSNGVKVSIDIPSGLYCDELILDPVAIQSDYTVSFQLPKKTFFFRENAKFTGEWFVVDIGLNQEYISRQETKFYWIDSDLIKGIYKKRERHSHKGNFGHSLLVAGSKGKMGAAVLAGTACLRSGTGLLDMMVPACGTAILQASLPEAMVQENVGIDVLENQPIAIGNYEAVGMGPGIGQNKGTKGLLASILEKSTKPIVLDADALNILGANRELLGIVPENSILTPHPKEFERMAGAFDNSESMLKLLQEFSQKRRVFVILKGGYTSIATPEGEIYFNSAGNPGMATAGSGDVLTGVVTGLLAQGYSPLNSAILGVFLHAKAGDLAAETGSQETLKAGDIINNLAPVFRLLSK